MVDNRHYPGREEHQRFINEMKPDSITDQEWQYYLSSDVHSNGPLRDKVEAALGWKKDDVDDARQIAEQVLGAVKIAEKGHVPEENLPRYRYLRKIAQNLGSLGGQVSGQGEYADANVLWAMEAKYGRMANELRADIPREEEQHGTNPEV